MSQYLPEIKKLMDKKLSCTCFALIGIHLKHSQTLSLVRLSGNRSVEGVLRGYDQFMNIVLEEGIEITKTGETSPIGTIVSLLSFLR